MQTSVRVYQESYIKSKIQGKTENSILQSRQVGCYSIWAHVLSWLSNALTSSEYLRTLASLLSRD